MKNTQKKSERFWIVMNPKYHEQNPEGYEFKKFDDPECACEVARRMAASTKANFYVMKAVYCAWGGS